MKTLLLIPFILFAFSSQSQKCAAELENILEYVTKGDSTAIVNQLSQYSKLTTSNSNINFKEIGVNIEWLTSSNYKVTLKPTKKVCFDGQPISKPFQIYDFEEALSSSNKPYLLNDFKNSGKTFIRHTKSYSNNYVNFYFSFKEPLLKSFIIDEVHLYHWGLKKYKLPEITNETKFPLYKVEVEVNGVTYATLGQYAMDIRPIYSDDYKAETDEETLSNLLNMLSKATKNHQKQEINYTIALLYVKMEQYDEAIGIMEQLVQETFKGNKRGILRLMELYIITGEYQKATTTSQKYGSNMLYNEYRLLKEFYSYVSNYLAGREDAKTLENCREALSFLHFPHMNWEFDLLKRTIPNSDKFSEKEKRHILEIVNEIEAANFWKENE